MLHAEYQPYYSGLNVLFPVCLVTHFYILVAQSDAFQCLRTGMSLVSKANAVLQHTSLTQDHNPTKEW